MIRALIIDDEEPSRLQIHKLLSIHSGAIQIIGDASCGSEAIEIINVQQPDLIFLDIHLMDMTGFDVLSKITVKSPYIIFTTAYDNYALQAFEVLSIEYLLKPIEASRFNSAIEKLKQMLERKVMTNVDLQQLQTIYDQSRLKKQEYSLAVKQGNNITLIDFQQISFLQAEDKYVAVNHLNGKKYLNDHTLTHLENQLPEYFLRVHRSVIVNIKHIKQIHKDFKSRYVIIMNDQQESRIQASISYKEDIKFRLAL
jgi:two-component system, LytTR family, response regulator